MRAHGKDLPVMDMAGGDGLTPRARVSIEQWAVCLLHHLQGVASITQTRDQFVEAQLPVTDVTTILEARRSGHATGMAGEFLVMLFRNAWPGATSVLDAQT
jgi:hypothetical protein